MKTQHTATPWKAKQATLNIKDPMFYKADVIAGGIRVAHVAGVGEEQANANASYIVRCVNSHEALVEACKMMIEDLKSSTNWKGLDSIATAEEALKQAGEL